MFIFGPLQKIFVEDVEIKNLFNLAELTDPGYIELGTAFFTFFIFASVFNAFNARTDKVNLFENIKGNKGFLKILALIAVVQICMTYVGGAILRCHGLDLIEWLVVLAMSISIIPIDLIRKSIIKNK